MDAIGMGHKEEESGGEGCSLRLEKKLVETFLHGAQSTFPVMKLEAGYILPNVFSLWDEVPSGTLQ